MKDKIEIDSDIIKSINELIIKSINGLRPVMVSINENPEREISQEDLKIFMLNTSGALMALHLLLGRIVAKIDEIDENSI
jgi:hypothetical protein